MAGQKSYTEALYLSVNMSKRVSIPQSLEVARELRIQVFMAPLYIQGKKW